MKKILFIAISFTALLLWSTTDIKALDRVEVDRTEWDFSTSIPTSIPGVEFHHRSTFDGEESCTGFTHTIEVGGKIFKIVRERCEGDTDEILMYEDEPHAS